MIINGRQVAEIQGVGADVARPVVEALGRQSPTRRRIGVIHTGAEIVIAKAFVLVVEPPVMTHFLAGNHSPPVVAVVARHVEIGVVELGRGLRDVTAAEPDRGDSEPAALPINVVADQCFASDWAAFLAAGAARCITHAKAQGLALPVVNRGVDQRGPIGRAQRTFHDERSRCPMIPAPAVVGRRRNGADERDACGKRDSSPDFHGIRPCSPLGSSPCAVFRRRGSADLTSVSSG